jgi:hypothetical protein
MGIHEEVWVRLLTTSERPIDCMKYLEIELLTLLVSRLDVILFHSRGYRISR